ncbi:putative AVT6-involved in amino acid efflux from the vacuole [Serendipita vermifera]|nr:putative AVT6-involved in amino acid efflux from the vacuole [Serendipita vermifera]
MAQIYQEEDDAALNQPLLGNSRPTEPRRTPNRKEGKAQLRSSVGNLANTILGTGMLSFPLAMASGGIIPGVITCVFSACTGALGLYFLSRCAAKAPYRRSSFFAVSQMTFPSASVWFDAAIAIKCFGVSISYLIIIKGLMPSVVEALYHNLLPSDPPEWALSGRMWISMFMVILVPLCFLRDLHSLRHTSYVALFSVAYLVVIVVVCYIFPPKGMMERGEVHLIHFTPSFIAYFPVQVFAYTCAQNLFPIYNELKSNTQERMNIVIGSSIGGACIIYEIVAVLGYLTFGSKVGANIMTMYPATSLFIAFGQLAIVILVLFSYPLQVHPCRNCLDKIVDAVFSKKHATPPPVANGTTHTEQEEDEDHDYDHGAHDEASPLRHTLLTAAIIVSGFTIAYFVNSLQIVLSFVGSTGSTTISFILPGLFFSRLFKDEPKDRFLVTLAKGLTVYGVCVFIFW